MCGEGEGWGYGGVDLSCTISNCGWEWKTELKDVDMSENSDKYRRDKVAHKWAHCALSLREWVAPDTVTKN